VTAAGLPTPQVQDQKVLTDFFNQLLTEASGVKRYFTRQVSFLGYQQKGQACG